MKIFGFELLENSIIIPSLAIGVGLFGSILYWKYYYNYEEVYNEDTELPLYLEHEYGNYHDKIDTTIGKTIPLSVFNFQQSLIEYIQEIFHDRKTSHRDRALVLGSETGKLVFELSEFFAEVKGIEKSFTKVVISYRLQNGNDVSYFFPLEGNKVGEKVIIKGSEIRKAFRNHDLKNVEPLDNVDIIHRHPCERLSIKLGVFQLIIVNRVLNAEKNPELVLTNLIRFIEPGGYLVIISDYEWKRDTNQYVGFENKELESTLDFFKSILYPALTFISLRNIPDIFGRSSRVCEIHNYEVIVFQRPTSQTSLSTKSIINKPNETLI